MAREAGTNGRVENSRGAMTDGSLAYSTEFEYRRKPTPERKPAERQTKRPAPRKKFSVVRYMKQNLFFPKLFAVGCIAAVAAVAFMSVIRFAKIASIQASINDIGKRIESTQEKIDELTIGSQPSVNSAEFADSVGLVPANP